MGNVPLSKHLSNPIPSGYDEDSKSRDSIGKPR